MSYHSAKKVLLRAIEENAMINEISEIIFPDIYLMELDSERTFSITKDKIIIDMWILKSFWHVSLERDFCKGD
jgi:hypothetical protein